VAAFRAEHEVDPFFGWVVEDLWPPLSLRRLRAAGATAQASGAGIGHWKICGFALERSVAKA